MLPYDITAAYWLDEIEGALNDGNTEDAISAIRQLVQEHQLLREELASQAS